ncbi:universal stress protein [Natronorarus salvus]|uniref:universal stress protein n=1 Tax=Natronorarus salvus TaxID=3117733 RepID=UPI002F261576
MYDDVLVPIDGSAAAEAALVAATDLADGRIHALSVVDDRAFLLLDDDLVEEVRAELGAGSDRALAAATDLDPTVEPVRREGDPVEEILAYADDEAVDAIVLGVGDPGYRGAPARARLRTGGRFGAGAGAHGPGGRGVRWFEGRSTMIPGRWCGIRAVGTTSRTSRWSSRRSRTAPVGR